MKKALKKLKEGNQRFVNGQTIHDIDSICSQRIEALQEQHPFAIVLGCSDSRVPAELVFDQGLGDLFVIRVAGNIAAPSQIGSIEYAVTHFGCRLVVVLGHADCGAIHATIEAINQPDDQLSNNIQSIVKRVRPVLRQLPDCSTTGIQLDAAIEANVNNTVAEITDNSAIIADRIRAGKLQVSGACYDLKTGVVEFYE